MARKRTFEISGLNIRVHTKHNFTEYVKLWAKLYSNRATALCGSSAMMIGEARRENRDDPKSPITGYFYKFLNIDPDEPWFDINRRKPATEEETAMVSIPDYLKPNLKLVPYIFLPTKHRLYFVSKASDGAMAASSVHRLIERLCLKQNITEEFGSIDITTLTNKKAIEDLLKWPMIKSLELYIERPNPLEDEDEADILERLDSLNAGSERIVLKKAGAAQSLNLDDRMKRLARVAADHGEVKQTGRNIQGDKDSASSKEFPMRERVTFEPNIQSTFQALVSYVVRRFL